jgi:hypothetical protein
LKTSAFKIFVNFFAFASIFLLSIIPINVYAQFYNGSQMEFGKNRIQYDQFLWSFYRFDKFDTYFYPGGKELAIYTAKTAKQHIREMESLLDYELAGKMEFIIYNKQSHFRQSNIGIGADERYNIGGVTRIVGTKVFLFFEGDHAKLDAQIRAGVAEIMVNEMLYGGDWREVMKNSALLVLPDWFIKGLISYISDPWNSNVENRVKDGILNNRYKKFNRLSGDEAVFAGHSLWHFIAETHGQNVISNILYMTHVSRNVESGFLFVLGSSLKTLTLDWQGFYKNKYENLEEQRNLPTDAKLPFRSKRNRVYSQLKVSPDGRYAAFVTNEIGRYKVFIYDRDKKKMRRIMKEGNRLQRINDYSYPLLAWHPSGEILSIIFEEKAKPHLAFYTMEDRKLEKRPIFILDKVIDFDYSHDGRKMVFSAVLNGQSDIYIYNIGANTQQQITNDIFDDLNPRFIQNSQQIIFSSNRPDDTLRIAKNIEIKSYSSTKDLFIYNLNIKSNSLRRVTNTPNIDEIKPVQWEDSKVAFLANTNRVYNRYLAEFDSVISHIDTVAHYRQITRTEPITNYPRHILEHTAEPGSNKFSEIVFNNGRYQLLSSEIGIDQNQNFLNFEENPFPLSPVRPKQRNRTTTVLKPRDSFVPQPRPEAIAPAPEDTLPKTKPRFQSIRVFDENDRDTSMIDINNYKFNEDVRNRQPKTEQKNDTLPKVLPPKETEQDEEEFVLPNIRNYNVTYFTDFIVTQVDNNFTNLTYQPFMGGLGFFNPGMNGLFKIGVSDLFEDRRIVGGVRLSPTLNANEYILSYEDLTKRIDRQFIFQRRGMNFMAEIGRQREFIRGRFHTHEARYINKYPFSEVASLRGTVSLRQDRETLLATSLETLSRPMIFDYWAGAKLEYVYDNVLPLGLNLYRGTRFKIFAEYYKSIPDVFAQQLPNQPLRPNINLYVIGADFRHYIKIHRDFIWANRLAASTSFGSHKLIYFMGGVDNWILPQYNYQTRIDFSQNYVFQALATNMRGFRQNSRNGNSFAVINSELRMPIFRYIINQPIKSDFINNFQIIGFGDIGTAWTGTHPYSEENTLNTDVIIQDPFIITLRNQREPIVGAYGFGLRSRLWGYFIRADWAWGIEDGRVQPRIFHLSLSLDF